MSLNHEIGNSEYSDVECSNINRKNVADAFEEVNDHSEKYIAKAAKKLLANSKIFADGTTISGEADPDYYVYNKMENKFIKLNAFRLGKYIKQNYGSVVKKSNCKALLEYVYRVEEPDNDIIEFSNGYYNIKHNEFSSKAVFTHNKLPHIYKPLVDCESGTLVEETLRKILIPKDSPNNLVLYNMFLYYVGAALLRAKPKVIVWFYGLGNDGKTILMKILNNTFINMSVTLEEKKLKDDFFKIHLGNKMVCLLDDMSSNAFVSPETRSTMKIISGDGNVKSRPIYSGDIVTVENFGVPFVACNYPPSVEHNDVAFYERTQYMVMPNKFVRDGKGEGNVYNADPNLSSNLLNDSEGYTWLISKAIDTFLHYGDSVVYQNANDTLLAINNEDLVATFVEKYVFPSDNNVLTNKDIRYYFMKWCLGCGYNHTNVFGCENATSLSQLIGSKLRLKSISKANTSWPAKYNCEMLLDFCDNSSYTDMDLRRVESEFFCEE